mmetsp:Transcript_74044/g.197383  ORF Transcript_74044/g.197383 Transcript_74044/m.197383 type:complete len:248 (-) Transcript_74044:117-860(-)
MSRQLTPKKIERHTASDWGFARQTVFWRDGVRAGRRLWTAPHCVLQVVRRYTAHIVEGLAYLHRQGIVHDAVKASNCLVCSGGVVKLADFGALGRLACSTASASSSKDRDDSSPECSENSPAPTPPASLGSAAPAGPGLAVFSFLPPVLPSNSSNPAPTSGPSTPKAGSSLGTWSFGAHNGSLDSLGGGSGAASPAPRAVGSSCTGEETHTKSLCSVGRALALEGDGARCVCMTRFTTFRLLSPYCP